MSETAYPVNTWLQDAVQMAADNLSARIDRAGCLAQQM